MLGQRGDGGPVGDVGAHPQLHAGICLAEALVYPPLVNAAVEMVFPGDGGVVQVCGGGDPAAVEGRGGDGAGIHQAHAGKLPLGGLGAFPVGEIAGGVAQGQAVVGGHVPGAEAGPAEAGLDHGAAFRAGRRCPDPGQLQADRDAGGIYVQGKVSVAAAAAGEDVRGLGDVVEKAACAAGDHALVRPDPAVMDLVREADGGLGEAGLSVCFHRGQDIRRVLLEVMDGPGVGGVEGQGDHRLHPG